MRYLCFLLLISAFLPSKAQVYKTYYTSGNQPTDNLKKAESYIIYQKLDGDSAWAMSRYDIHDTIMAQGTFKDKLLRIPHGKFTYYKYLVDSTKYLGVLFKNNKMYNRIEAFAHNYVAESGVYLNGKKNGVWKIYNHGKLASAETYEDDVLNGLYQSFGFDSGHVVVEGNIINNVRQGDWNTLAYNGDIIKTELYKDGEIIKTVSYLNDEKFRFNSKGLGKKYNLVAYLNDKLQNARFKTHGQFHVEYALCLDADNKFVGPHIIGKSAAEIDDAVIKELTAAPNWEPTIVNDAAKIFLLMYPTNVEAGNDHFKAVTIPLVFDIDVDHRGKINISYANTQLFKYD